MYGKLGHGDESGCSLPKKVETGLTGIHVVNVACGSRHTACFSSDGKLFSWGDKENGVAGHGDIEGKILLHVWRPIVFLKSLNLSNVIIFILQDINTHRN
jgi:alpha-tubulin suppressor-like RCC1 family protein